MGVADERSDENDSSAAVVLSAARPDDADDTHVRGLVPPALGGNRARGEVRTEV